MLCGTLDPWRWGHHVPSKRREPFTHGDERHVPEDRNPRPFHSFPHCIQANFQLVGLSGNSRGAPVRISKGGGGHWLYSGPPRAGSGSGGRKKNSAGPQHGRTG